MNVYFMFDNHTFKKLGDSCTPRSEMEAVAKELFQRDQYGSLFACFEADRYTYCAVQDGKYCITDAGISEFFDRLEERLNWISRG